MMTWAQDQDYLGVLYDELVTNEWDGKLRNDTGYLDQCIISLDGITN
jgi:hypothetical protein